MSGRSPVGDVVSAKVVQQWIERAWHVDRVNELAELIHANHPLGAKGIVESFKDLHGRVQDVKAAVTFQLANAGTVATCLKLSGVVRGEPVGWDAVYIHTVRDGKIADFSAVASQPAHG